ncbi:MAG: AI-2E family transporter [Lachnospiraceae bacterium]
MKNDTDDWTEKTQKVIRGWKKYLPMGITAFLVLSGAVLFCFLIFHLRSLVDFAGMFLHILQPVFLGLVFAYLLTPVVKRMERRLNRCFRKAREKMRYQTGVLICKPARCVAISVTMFTMLICIYILGYMVLPELAESVRMLIQQLPSQVSSIVDKIQNLANRHPELSRIFNGGETIVSVSECFHNWLQSDVLPAIYNLALGVRDIVVVLINAVIGIVISVYVLYARERFIGQAKKCLYILVPNPRHARRLLEIVRISDRVFGGFLSGVIVQSLILGILCFIGMSIFHMPYSMLISVIVGVTNVIPLFGPYIGGILGGLLIFLDSPVTCLYFVLFIFILQQIDGNLIGPKVLGDSTGLSPFWIMFAILIGGGLFGVAGMLLGIPVFAVFYQLVRSYVNRRLEGRGIPIDPLEVFDIDYIREDDTVVRFSDRDGMLRQVGKEIRKQQDETDRITFD